MPKLLKYGVSVVGLAVGLSLATYAQDMDRDKGPSQGPSQMQTSPDRGGSDRDRGNTGKERSQQMQNAPGSADRDRNKREGAAEQRDRREGAGEQRDRREGAGERNEPRGEGRADRNEGRGDGGKKGRVTVNITPEKKTVIRERVITSAPKKYTRNEVHFSLSVGTRVPRDFAVYHVPPTFVEIVPEYRDYDYIVVGDMLLIIDPATREIVDVIAV